MAYFPAVRIIDPSNVARGVNVLDGNLSTIAQSFPQSIVRGLQPANVSVITKFARATPVNNTRIILGNFIVSTYPWLTSGIRMSLVSSSAADNATGTGVRSVIIFYLDANYQPATEIVTLNGTTRVYTTATNILRVNALFTNTVGTGLAAAGNITLQNTAGTVTYAQISVGRNQDEQLIYTVPAGKKFYLTEWAFSCGSAASGAFVESRLEASQRFDGTVIPRTFFTYDSSAFQDRRHSMEFSLPILFNAMTDIQLTVIADAANANATCVGRISGWLE